MAELTVILAALAVVLFLAVWLFDLSKPKRQKFQEQSNSEVQVYFNKELASEERLPADYSTTETMIALQAKLNGLSRKTEMAHSRLDDLEQEIVSAKSEKPEIGSIEETRLLPLEKKLEKLDSFRSETEYEIKALKEILASQISARQNPFEGSFDSLKRKDEEFLQQQIFKSRTPRAKRIKA